MENIPGFASFPSNREEMPGVPQHLWEGRRGPANGECLSSCPQGLNASSSCRVFAEALYSNGQPESLGQGLRVNGVKGRKQVFQIAQNTFLIYLLNTPQMGNRPCSLRRKYIKPADARFKGNIRGDGGKISRLGRSVLT